MAKTLYTFEMPCNGLCYIFFVLRVPSVFWIFFASCSHQQ